jgi:long-chain acyl-CoA synthetase
MDFFRLFDILPYQQARYAKVLAFSRKTADGIQEQYSSQEALNRTQALAAGLLDAGIRSGDRVGIIAADNSPDWHFHDFAIQQVHAVVVPIHAASTENDLYFILRDAGMRFCFVTDEGLAARIRANAPESLEKVWLFSGEGALPVPDSLDEKITARLAEIRDAVADTELATILYTSGTTGEPKGVMLSHRNIVSNIKSVITLVPVDYTCRVFSYLPLSHIFERMVTYSYMAAGATIYYPRQAGTLMEDLREARPHYFTAVPRVLEKFYAGIVASTAKRSLPVKRLSEWAVKIGNTYKTGKTFPPAYWIQLAIADFLVFRHWRRALGGHIQGIMVGAAALRPQLGRLFSAARIHVREGYGLTESSPVIAFNRFDPGGVHFGTVGIPIPGVEVRIAAPDETGEGEILARGPNVMLGYYNRPAETAQTIDAEGWLHTGDVGKFVHKRFLQITDRQKDLFKVSGGRYVAPQMVEKVLTESPYIEYCIVAGADRPFVSALIVPDFERLEAWCNDNGIHWTAPQFMALHPKVHRFIQEEIERYSEPLPHFQRVKRFILLHEPWDESSGHLTPTLKLRRSLILRQYDKELAALYNDKEQ